VRAPDPYLSVVTGFIGRSIEEMDDKMRGLELSAEVRDTVRKATPAC